MTKFERLELARKRDKATWDALLGFAEFVLPVRMRRRFDGDGGREAFELGAVFGNSLTGELSRVRFCDAARRAHLFLLAMPRFRRLFGDHERAAMGYSEARYWIEKEDEEYERDIEETYRLIERGIWADAGAECRDLGLVEWNDANADLA